MDQADRAVIERVLLKRIPREAWDVFLKSDEGNAFRQRLVLVRATLVSAGLAPLGAPARPVAELIDVYGGRILANSDVGPWLRRVLLQHMPSRNWSKLKHLYTGFPGQRTKELHGNMTQPGAASNVMADYWHQGGRWAMAFCELAGLPVCLSERDGRDRPADEEIWPAENLSALHDYQVEVYEALRKLIRKRAGTAMLSMPTGAGKTRVAVEAICDHLASNAEVTSNVVLWIAQSEELQQQAWECFRQVWQAPSSNGHEGTKRVGPLRLICAWGGRKMDSLELDAEKTIIIAGIQQLHSWIKNHPKLVHELFPKKRRAVILIDEAHRSIAPQHREVLLGLNLRLKNRWHHPRNAAAVIGLTATPWRTEVHQDESLRSYFGKKLLRPYALGDKPIQELQKRNILSRVTYEALKFEDAPRMTAKQRRDFETYHELPSDYLKVLGRDVNRNTLIIHRLRSLAETSKVLLFACSVEHAELLTLLLNRAQKPCAAVITGNTPRGQRAGIIESFRHDNLKYLCNVGVLTTGFDAPKANVICLTRPTCSALLYEQMVGRGLRGPKNGGTEECRVIDVQDEGLPRDVQSYARVVELWDGGLQPATR